MRELMSDEPHQEGGNQVEGVDDEGDRIAEHDLVSIGQNKEGPDPSGPLERMNPGVYAAAASGRMPTETVDAADSSEWTALLPRRMPPSSMISEPTRSEEHTSELP